MIEVIDQTWVEAWVNDAATKEEASLCRTWLRNIDPQWFALVVRFPPLAIVKANKPLAVPYPFTVGYISGYTSTGRLTIHQCPDSLPAEVDEKDLTVVGYWKGLSPQVVQQLLPRRTPHGILRF